MKVEDMMVGDILISDFSKSRLLVEKVILDDENIGVSYIKARDLNTDYKLSLNRMQSYLESFYKEGSKLKLYMVVFNNNELLNGEPSHTVLYATSEDHAKDILKNSNDDVYGPYDSEIISIYEVELKAGIILNCIKGDK